MLPPGWRLALHPSTRRIDGGAVLVGGSPLRLLRLTGAGARLVDGFAGGEPVGGAPASQRLARRLLDAGMADPVPGPADGSAAADVTVVIPVRDRPDGLATTLAHLGPVARVVVVDDASTGPETAGVVERAGADVVRHEVNRGPAAARNTGWRLAATDVVAFVDADCRPEEGWLAPLLAHLGDPAVAAVAPRTTSAPMPGLPAALARYEAVRPSLDRGPRASIVRPRSRVPFVPATMLVLRRAALEAVGGFDEDLRVGEDVDLVWRLDRAGWTVRYEPTVAVAHPNRASAAAWLRQRFDYGTSAAPLARRHGAAVAPLSTSPWTALSWGLVAAGAPGAGAAVAVSTTALLGRRLGALRRPWREAARLAGLGHLYGGLSVSDAVRRTWWPLALVVALALRRARPGVALAVLGGPAWEWVATRPRMGPAAYVALRVVDDIAYGAGVWAGCVVERSTAALRPDLVSWPGHRPPVEDSRPAQAPSPP